MSLQGTKVHLRGEGLLGIRTPRKILEPGTSKRKEGDCAIWREGGEKLVNGTTVGASEKRRWLVGKTQQTWAKYCLFARTSIMA
jgi:hypothetical protein